MDVVAVQVSTLVSRESMGWGRSTGLMSLLVCTPSRYEFHVVNMTLNRLIPPTSYFSSLKTPEVQMSSHIHKLQ